MPILRHHTVLGGGSGLRNYFGDGSDGDIRITSAGAEQSFDGGVTWTTISTWTLVGTVVSIPSLQDGDMVVVNARSLTIDSGYTLTVANRCRGLLVFGLGNLTLNGVASMTARGCHANPADSTVTTNTPVAPSDGNPVDVSGLHLGWFATGSNTPFTRSLNGCGTAAVNAIANQPEGNGVQFVIPRVCGLGGEYVTNPSGSTVGNSGGTASGPGGGGSGGVDSGGTSGTGGKGTCFSGGPGGGGAYVDSGSAEDGDDYGGKGGDGDKYGDRFDGGGGAGNPGGAGGWTTSTDPNGDNGVGGWMLFVFKGQLSGSGSLESKGANGGCYDQGTPVLRAGGGGSAGGFVGLAHGGQDNSSITLDTDGGLGGGLDPYGPGGPGGEGFSFRQKIDA